MRGTAQLTATAVMPGQVVVVEERLGDGERVYIWLSLAANSVLCWLIFAAKLAPVLAGA